MFTSDTALYSTVMAIWLSSVNVLACWLINICVIAQTDCIIGRRMFEAYAPTNMHRIMLLIHRLFPQATNPHIRYTLSIFIHIFQGCSLLVSITSVYRSLGRPSECSARNLTKNPHILCHAVHIFSCCFLLNDSLSATYQLSHKILAMDECCSLQFLGLDQRNQPIEYFSSNFKCFS